MPFRLATMLVCAMFMAQAPTNQPSFQTSSILTSAGGAISSLAPGMLMSIYGEHLGPAQPCQGYADTTRRHPQNPRRPNQAFAETLIYKTELCGVHVFVGDLPAGLLYVQERQINFQVPQEMPLEGTAKVRVVYGGQSGEAGPLPLGLKFAKLALEKPAYVGMPIWIKVSLPFGWDNLVRYPSQFQPFDFGCSDLEVRRGGVALPRISRTRGAILHIGAGTPCGFIGLPREPTNKGRLPLHLLYRFDRPGTHEVRYILRNWSDLSAVAKSEWMRIQVRSASKDERAQWLARMSAAHPSDTVDLLTDFLPSILGVPDEASLVIISRDLYHPDRLVRQYVSASLGYWPDAEVRPLIERLLREKGPSDVIASYLSRDQKMPAEVP